MYETLEKEFEYYLKNQDRLVEKHNGRIVAIKDCAVIGVFDSVMEAIVNTARVHELGTFIVQEVGPGKELYTQTFHSRVTYG